MRFAETFGGPGRLARAWRTRHAGEDALLAVLAGGGADAHVSSCASCQARLAELRAWTADVAADAGAIADDVFTSERLAAQKKATLRRLESLGRSARVIAFPAGLPAPVLRGTHEMLRWTAAAACAGIVVGLASGRLIDRHPAGAPVALADREPAALSAVVSPSGISAASLDETALLDAAYDRVSIDALRTIDDITPRAREVAFASMPGPRR